MRDKREYHCKQFKAKFPESNSFGWRRCSFDIMCNFLYDSLDNEYYPLTGTQFLSSAQRTYQRLAKISLAESNFP